MSEEIGVWIPVPIINKEHDDKPEGEQESGNYLVAYYDLLIHEALSSSSGSI